MPEIEELQKRVDKLEKLVNRMYHEHELLAIYIPRLSELLIKHFTVSGENRKDFYGAIRGTKSFLKILDKDMQIHYKSHLDKKRTPIDRYIYSKVVLEDEDRHEDITERNNSSVEGATSAQHPATPQQAQPPQQT